MTVATIQDILGYWFGEFNEHGTTVENKGSLWWGGGAELDREIRERFGETVEAAGRGELNHWAETAEGRLALVILLDQFTRNVYRKTAKAFSFDPLARSLVLEGLANGHDKELHCIQRVFFYMPLEHSEEMVHQEQCVEVFEALLQEVVEEVKPVFQDYLNFAYRHKAIIDRFGRYPHRNNVLARESTQEELEYLGGGGDTFGQG